MVERGPLVPLDGDALCSLLRERLSESVRVDERPDGALMVRTPLTFPDGDRYPIHISEAPSGGLCLSDRGHTLMRISYEHDVDSLLDGVHGSHLERIMGESGMRWDGGAFCLDTSIEHLPAAIFIFGQALTRVYDLTTLDANIPPLHTTTKSA